MLTFSFLVFLGCLGAGLLLLSVILDGAFDFMGDEPIVPTFAFAVSIFGFTGALTESLMEDPNALVYGGVGGAVAVFTAGLFFVVYRGMMRSVEAENSHVPELSELLGKTVTIDWWNGNRGEVQAPWHGGTRRTVSATSEEDLKGKTTAYIVDTPSKDTFVISSTPPQS